MQILKHLSKSKETEFLQVRSEFDKFQSCFICILKFKNHWCRPSRALMRNSFHRDPWSLSIMTTGLRSNSKCNFHVIKNAAIWGLPWWLSGWGSACQCRGHGFEPWSGKIPHAAEQLSPWATITEPARLEPVLRNKRGHDNERPAHIDEEWPPLASTGESPRTETKTQHSHK